MVYYKKMSMKDYTIDQMMLFIGGCASSLVLVILASQKSKCSKIGCCGCMIERDVSAVIAEERLEMTGHTGATPRKIDQSSISESVSKKELSEPASEPESLFLSEP
jgi:hypothetical protein